MQIRKFPIANAQIREPLAIAKRLHGAGLSKTIAASIALVCALNQN